MTELKKLPSDIEENIQNLAGDIYLQIEDKITALLSSYTDNIPVTPETITQHPLYQELKEQQQTQQQQASKSLEEYDAELAALRAEKESQQTQLAQLQEELSNAEKLNNAKLTDSEQVLKDKLAESSQLAHQVAKLSQENAEQQQLLKEVTLASENTAEKLKDVTKENDSLAKNDKAKAATLAVQNQQYSDLQLKFDQVSSELEYLKAEQEHKLLSTNEQLTHEQQQAEQLHGQIFALQKDLKDKQVAFDEQQEKLTNLAHENTDLTTKVNSLEQTITQIEASAKAAQEQHETEKQQINAKRQSEEEKSSEQLKQASADNEKVMQQLHDVERHKQAIENELVGVKSELAAVNKQQLQTLDTVKTLEQEVEKQQAETAQVDLEKTRVTEALAQAEQKYKKEHEQHTQQIKDLTQALEKANREHEAAQKDIADLTQQNQTQTTKISSLVQQAESEQLKFQQTLDKQAQNHQQIVTGHQQELTEKNKALTELQRQADKNAKELSQQLSTKAELLEAESTKLAELQQLHNKALAAIEKAEQGLNEKQQQLTLVQTELEKDRAAMAKNRLWHQENKDKQESEYNKARETIKYLRDENSELNRKLEQQVHELEDKVTEYRLRFEYAQKELTKLSN